MNSKSRLLPSLAVCVALSGGGAAAALPISGRPVPALAQLDTIMDSFMTDSTRAIGAGVLGVSRGGRVIYLRAFGSLSPGVNLPETALFRLASVVKPITAAAVHQLSAAGGFGATNLQRRVFNLSGNGGILTISPPATVDVNAQNITLGHLLNHSGGWDRRQPSPGDIPINHVRAAGIQMNEPDALPSRVQVMNYGMQFALNFAPGTASYTPTVAHPSPTPATFTPGPGTTYSNFGYLLLGEVLEATAGGGYLGYLGNNILSAQNWIPARDWGEARSRESEVGPREPAYDGGSEGSFQSVYDYTAPIATLPAAYGGLYHVETMLAHGGLVASAQAMLRFGNLYNASYTTTGAGTTQSNTIGQPVAATGFAPGSDMAHTGALPGTNTVLRQLGNAAGAADDVVIYVALNKRSGTDTDWAFEASTEVLTVLNGLGTPTTPWPTETCDGFWVTLGAEQGSIGHGSYDSNCRGFHSALSRAGEGSYVRLRPGTQNWTGTITGRVRLDAPEGPASLGLP